MNLSQRAILIIWILQRRRRRRRRRRGVARVDLHVEPSCSGSLSGTALVQAAQLHAYVLLAFSKYCYCLSMKCMFWWK